MAKRTLRERVTRLAMAVAVGGTAFQLSGCDPAVRNTLLTGLEETTGSLLTALNTAFFLSLQDDTSGDAADDSSITTTP